MMNRDTKIALGLAAVALVIGVVWFLNSRGSLFNSGKNEVTVDVIPLTLEAKKFEHVPFVDGQTALEVTRSVIAVETETSASGTVVSLGGIRADATNSWLLRVNGVPSNVDAATYKVQPSDLLSWRLSPNN